MSDNNKASRVEFNRIETGVLGNCREQMKNIAELAADIRERGLLQNLLVWHKRMKKEAFVLPDGKEVWDRYILIGGNRRHAAITRIRDEDPKAFETVPVTLLVGNEDDALFAQISENLQREDLTPVDLANAVYRMKQRGHTQAEIARRLSKSQPWVSRLLRVRENACEEVLRAVGRGELSLEVALVIADLDDKKQLAALERFRAASGASGKTVASRDARQSAGRVVRPSVGDIRERLGALGNGAPTSRPGTPDAIAHAILAWVLGTGEWPASITPPGPPSRA